MKVSNKKAFVFAMSVIILALTFLIATTMAVMLMRTAYTARRLSSATQAYFLAEAGLEVAIRDYYDDGFALNGWPTGWITASKTITVATGKTCTVTLNTANYAARSEILVTSVSTVGNPDAGGATRTISLLVKDTTPPAFKYPALGGGRVVIKGGSEVWGDVHSNYSGWLNGVTIGGWGWWGASNTGDVHLWGGIPGTGEVTTVDDGIFVHPTNGTVDSGVTLTGQPAVPLPPFNATFYQWYYDQANTAGELYTTDQDWDGETLTSSTDVIYVQGDVDITGNTSLTGCLVAEGDIIIGFDIADSFLQHNLVGTLPALMSRYGKIKIYDPVNVNGMIYAQDEFSTNSLIGAAGPCAINGAVYAGAKMLLNENTKLTYVQPNPPGLTAASSPLKIMCWNE